MGVRDVLALRGLTAEVVGHTLLMEDRHKLGWYDGNRWNEIKHWLDGHPEVTHWAVLEDALVDDIPPRTWSAPPWNSGSPLNVPSGLWPS